MSIQNEKAAAIAAAAIDAWKEYERTLESVYVELQAADSELATALAEVECLLNRLEEEDVTVDYVLAELESLSTKLRKRERLADR